MSSQRSLAKSGHFIEQSWKRCHLVGLNRNEKADDQLITGSEIKELQRHYQPLITHAEAVFHNLYPLIKQSGCVLFLTDPNGTILFAVGDPDFASHAAKVQLQVGANWHESRKGTNAIGVAIEERIPAVVRGSEHFFQENHFLTCDASPIFDQTGSFLGVINISGSRDTFHPTLARFAPLAAEIYQNRLLLQQIQAKQLVALRQLEVVTEHHPLPLVTLDADQRITGANQAAAKLLGDCIGKELPANPSFKVITIQDDRNRVFGSVAIGERSAKEMGKGQQTEHTERFYRFSDIMGTCPSIVRAKEMAKKASDSNLPVLLTGESGTGKELFAQAIHSESGREPFIAVNCSAIPDTLIESELFGYERGAFTGANKEGGLGKFQAADGGTLFLDEIGDMSLRAQAALLRAVQEKTVTPVGSVKSTRVDVRIIAATHRDLLKEVQAGRFRADLYYRLKGVTIPLPPLRLRSDIRQLAEYLLYKHVQDAQRLSPAALDTLASYPWPGNIRELQSVLLQASFLAEGAVIEPKQIVLDVSDSLHTDDSFSLREKERMAIEQALKEANGNISKAARLLGIGRNTLYRKIKEYQLEQRNSVDRQSIWY
ncbi:sigma-54-dependent Fis family transcriptional regulator [Brevibacillus humidisoli]|uniref:sigma-54-dependent Fis family transcriptional regulator n=1 Tax=Brevibacillus humidisoli TaxID=2895522 RepID=UPI001E612821|nr:sigma-54-dependent Fis family transcriptional regulator [Brevibacillus humidisoli]UFJ39635.1 sigma-54-dependent Fis family transcriptional regulator [Brevibacillus humidisoli]